MLDKVVGTDLKARRLRAQIERLANIHAHGNSPCVSRIRRPVEGHSGVGVDVPSALPVVGVDPTVVSLGAIWSHPSMRMQNG
jgi:hypothetical protein